MKPLDVHGLTLDNAINVIKKNIEIAYKNGENILYVNHGFNNGHKIKSWCLKEGLKLAHVIKVEPGDNEGISKFYISLNLKKIF